MGIGSSGQLGTGSSSSSSSSSSSTISPSPALPIKTQKLALVSDLLPKKIKSIGAGERFSVAVTDDSEIWIWGTDTNKSLTASTVSSVASVESGSGLSKAKQTEVTKVYSGFNEDESEFCFASPAPVQFSKKNPAEVIQGIYCGGWHILVQTNGTRTY
jgi:alpha-tubulin suppressor-like RCC1 family protein